MMMKTTSKKIYTKYVLITIFLLLLALFLSFESQPNYLERDYFLETIAQKSTKKPNFKDIDNFKQRKKVFIAYMLPAIKIANHEICLQKEQVHKIEIYLNENDDLNKKLKTKFNQYLKYYKIKPNKDKKRNIKLLKLKVGSAPTSFVLAQAILESGWGTSRFAKDYNNYFGLHCFSDNCGAKALAANVYLEVFSNINEGVLGYYYRLNTGSKFKKFRITRKKILEKTASNKSLLNSLENYSEIGKDEYEKRLLSIIDHNNLTKYDTSSCS